MVQLVVNYTQSVGGSLRTPSYEAETTRTGYLTDGALPTPAVGDFPFADEPSVNKDTILTGVDTLHDTASHQVLWYQMEVDYGQGAKILDLDFGPVTGMDRRVFGRQDGVATQGKLRAVMVPKCVIGVGTSDNEAASFGDLAVNDVITDAVTGTSATIVDFKRNHDHKFYLIVNNITGGTGQFGGGNNLQVGGVTKTTVRTRADWLGAIYVQNSSEEIFPGEELENVGATADFYVQSVDYMGGSTGSGTWSAKIWVQMKSGTPLLGDSLKKTAAFGGAACGDIPDWGLRPHFDPGFEENGYVTPAFTNWSSANSAICTEGAATVTVTPNRGLVTGEVLAGEHVFFRAEAKGFSVRDPRRNLSFKWTNPDVYTMSNMDANRSEWGRSSQYRFSAYATGFTLVTPGTRRVTCECIDETTHAVVASGFADVVVDDPDVVFAGKTLTVGSDPGDDHTTIAAAMAVANAAGGDRRIQVRGGETFVNDWTAPAGIDRFLMEPIPATGRYALEDVSLGMGSEEGAMICLRGFDLDNLWRSASASNSGFPKNGVSARNILGGHVSLFDFTAQGFGQFEVISPKAAAGHDPTGGDPGMGYFGVANAKFSGWYNFAMFSGDIGHVSTHGVDFIQDDAALRSPGPTHKAGDNETGGSNPAGLARLMPRMADHGPIRWSRPFGLRLHEQSYFFTNNSWTGGHNTPQENFRDNEGGLDGPELWLALTSLTFENGGMSWSQGDNPGKKQANFHGVVDRFHYVAVNAGGDTLSNVKCGGMVLRNFVITIQDGPAEGSRAIANMFKPRSDKIIGSKSRGNLDGEDDQSIPWFDTHNQPTEIYNGTIYDERSAAFMTGQNLALQTYTLRTAAVGTQMDLSKVAIRNILEHRPNDSGAPITTHLPLDLTPGAWAGHHDGIAGPELIYFEFNNCDGDFDYDDGEGHASGWNLHTGSGAETRMFCHVQTGGSYAGGTATGWGLLRVRNESPMVWPQVGDVITSSGDGTTGNVLTLTSVGSENTNVNGDGVNPGFTSKTIHSATIRPQAGSAAIGAAVAPWPVYDFEGVARGSVSGDLGARKA